MINDQLSQVVRRWVYRVRPTARPGFQVRPSLRLEECEARLAPATLPAVGVSNTQTVNTPNNNQDTLLGFSPQAAYNPADPNKIVLVSTDGSGILVQYSTNAGATWSPIFTTQRTSTTDGANRLIDLTIPTTTNGPRVFTNSSGASVAFGRDGVFYVAEIQRNQGNTSGAVVVHRFSFAPGAATPTLLNGTGTVLYRWAGADPALNVAVAVDNNIATKTVVGSGAFASTFTDTLAAGKTAPGGTSSVPSTTLTQAITATATTIPVTSAAGISAAVFAQNGQQISASNPIDVLVDSELVRVIGVSGNTLTVANNGTSRTPVAGTVAASHLNGSVLQVATYLTGPVTSSQTTITVNNSAGFVTSVPFDILVGTEQIKVTGVSGNTWTIIRGVNTTTPAAHAANALVTGAATAFAPVYVAWNTNATNLSGAIARGGLIFNPAVVLASGSGDGGANFSSPVPVSDAQSAGDSPGGYFVLPNTTYGAASPKIVFSQGDGLTGNGGRLTFVWNQISGPGLGQVVTDSSQPDGGNAASQAVTSLTATGTGGAIAPATAIPVTPTARLTNPVLTAADTSLTFQYTLANTSLFPTNGPFTILVDAELINVGGVVGNTLVNLIRGVNGTTAAVHLAGAQVEVASATSQIIPAGTPGATFAFTVANANGFPAVPPGYNLLVTNPTTGATETMTVTNLIGSTFVVTRGNPALAFPINSVVTAVPRPVSNTTNYVQNVTIPSNFGTVTNLEVLISMRTPNLQNYSVVLVGPNGNFIELLSNRNTAAGAKLAPANGIADGVNGGNDLGFLNGSSIATGGGVTFSDYAPRSVNDPTNTFFGNTFQRVPNTTETSLLGSYRPDANFLSSESLTDFFNQTGNGAGQYTLQITEYVPTTGTPRPPQVLVGWALKLTGAATPYFGGDAPTLDSRNASVTASGGNPIQYQALPGGVDNVNPLDQDLAPNVGIGPGVSLAYDTTLYAEPATTVNAATQTSHPGRLYMVYTGVATTVDQIADRDPNDTDIFLISSDDDGQTWTDPVRVNDDVITDGTEGNRTQFLPTVAVDPLTGTVVVTWYDTRNDASGDRAATYVATSIDGGITFSPQTFLNTPKQATNAITGAVQTIEPIPTNLQHADDPNGGNSYVDPQLAHGVGTQQALIAYGGRINAFWTGTYSYTASGSYNRAGAYLGTANGSGAAVFTATVSAGSGPRVVSSDQGSITTIGQFLETTGQNVAVPRVDVNGNTVAFITYNDKFATAATKDALGNAVAPGTRLLDGFIVRFDREIDPTTFDPTDIVVQWEKAGLVGGVAPAAVDLSTLGVRYRIFVVPTSTYATNSVYFVQFVDAAGKPLPQGGVGTYSYAILNRTTLTAAVTATATTLTVASAAGFPAAGTFLIQVDGEVMTVTAVSGNTLTVTRTVATAVAHAAGASVTAGPNIRDTVDNPITGATGNLMDQNADGVAGAQEVGDVYAVPTSVNGGAFQKPYTTDTRPLIVPGPYVVSQTVANQYAKVSSVAIDTTQVSSLLLTLTTAVDPTSFGLVQITLPDGTIIVPTSGLIVSFEAVDALGNPSGADTRYYRITLVPPKGDFLPLGNYSVVLEGNPTGSPTPAVASLVLDTTQSTALEVTFDRTVAAANFTAADILSLVGPKVISTTQLAAAVAASDTTVTVFDASGFPAAGGFQILIDSEYMSVTSVAGNVLTVTRGAGATTHDAGAIVSGLVQGSVSVLTQTTLTADVTAASTTFSVASTDGFPTTGNFRILVDNEPMNVLSVDPVTNTVTVSRGSGAVAHKSGAAVTLVPTVLPIDQAGNLTASPTKYFRVIPVLPKGSFLSAGTYSAAVTPNRPSADGLFLNTGAQSVDVTFDRDMDPASVTNFTQVQLYGPLGAILPTTTLTAAASATATTLTVASAAGFPTTGSFLVLIDGETLTVTGVAGNTLTVTRGAGATAHAAGATVAAVYTITQVGTSARTYRITFPVNPITQNGDYSLVLAPVIGVNGLPLGPKSAAGDALDTNLNAGLDRLRGTSSNGAAIVTNGYGGQPLPATPGTAINPGQTVDVPLDVADDFVLAQDLTRFPNLAIQVGFDITYPTDPDLQISLVAPDGTSVLLYRSFQANTGGTVANFTNTFLSDIGKTPISQGSAPYTSDTLNPYDPQLPLSALLGRATKGTWKLHIVNTGGGTGRVNKFSLILPHADTTNQTGLGEAVADRATIGLRVFFQDPTTAQSQNQWTAVNNSTNNGASAGQATATAIDPSDASGNTVYVGGASGGVWKTTNFLTIDPKGPTWVPLTDGGPTYSLNIASISVIGRNNDANQSIVFALTGEGNSGSQGVGLLRSMDGGKTWDVLDSTKNADALGNILPITVRGTASFQRDGLFYGATGYKLAVDPTPISPGNYVVWMAVQGSAAQAGLWRSLDTGRTWTRIQAGAADDVVYAPGSADPATGLLQRLYVAFQGDGVYYTASASGTASLIKMIGGQGNNLVQDYNINPPTIVPVSAPADTPNGAKGRIVLAVPGFSDQPLLNSVYQDWVYALVANPDGTMDGLYMTKDFGRNWVKVQLPGVNPSLNPNLGLYETYPTNNESRPDIDLFGNPSTNGGGKVGIPILTSPSYYPITNYAMGLAVDPLNPNVVYAAGLGSVAAQTAGGSVRIDVSAINDHEAFVFYDDSKANEPATVATASKGAAIGRPIPGDPNPHGYLYIPGGFTIYTNPDGTTTDFTSLIRDPLNPFVANASLRVGYTLNFSNNGENAKYTGFADILNPAANSTTFGGDFVKSILTFVDPLTKKTRLIYATENGLFSGVDAGDGTLVQSIGFDPAVSNNRNGNLQLQQFTSGAVQPSQLAADIAGTLFYATGRDNGFAVSSNNVLQTGNTNWTGQRGSGVGSAVDPAGSGTAYQYRQACCGNDDTTSATTGDFFRVLIAGSDQAFGGGTGRTQGLLTEQDDPGSGLGQWPQDDFSAAYNSPVGYFAVNPVRADTSADGAGGIVIGSAAGRVYLTDTLGKTWFPIADPTKATNPDLDGSIARALAFGSPDTNATQTGYDSFIYAGMTSGRVYVTHTAGAPWTALNGGNSLDGTPIMKIDADPRRGTRDAFVVTQRHVYYLAENTNSNGTYNGTYTIKDVTGNLFTLGKQIFGDTNSGTGTAVTTGPSILNALQYLTTIAVDWRFAVPVDPTNPTGATFPYVYVGGAGGVFRSTNVLASGTATDTWQFYPSAASGAVVDGGYLPDAVVSDLDLSTGAIDATTGLSIQNQALNLLVATTYGRGQYAIRLNPQELPVYSYQPGPRVVSVTNTNPPAGPSSTLRVTFNTAIDPNTFTPADVVLTGPTGAAITVTAVTPVTSGGASATTTFDITFTSSAAAGAYTVKIGPNISDPGGNLMNQNLTYPNGEAADAYTGQVILNSNVTDTLAVNTTQVNGTTVSQSGLPGQVAAGDVIHFNAAAYLSGSSTPDGNYPANAAHTGFLVIKATGAGTLVNGVDINATATKSLTVAVTNGQTADITVQFKQSGGQSVTVSSAATPADANPVTAYTSVVAGVATSLQWGTPTVNGVAVSSVPAGVPVSVTLTALDSYGNVATAYNSLVNLTTNDPKATIDTPAYTFAPGDAGRHTFQVTFGTAGTGQTVTATPASGTATAVTSPPVVVTPGPLSTVSVSGFPAAVVPGTPGSVAVTLTDAYGNQVSNFPGTIHFTSSDPNAALPPDQYLPSGSGAFTVTLNTPGAQSITATATYTATTSTGSQVVAISGSQSGIVVASPKVVVSGFPTSTTPGKAGTVTVKVTDALGNVLTNYPVTVHFTSSDPAATLPADQVLTGGQADFQVTLNTAGTQSITVTVTGSAGTQTGSESGIQVIPPVGPPPVTNNPPVVSAIPNQSVPSDGKIGPIVFTVSDDITPAAALTVTFASSDGTAVPVSGIATGGSGGTRTVTITPNMDVTGLPVTSTVSVIVTDGSGASTIKTFQVTVTAPLVPLPPTTPVSPPVVPPVVPPLSPSTPAFVTSTGAGTPSTVAVYAANGSQISKTSAFEDGYTGGSRVALASEPDGYRVVTVAAPGRGSDVRVTNLGTGAVQGFQAFEASFTGGLYVSTGDLNGDGYDDYVITPDQGGGPRVEIVSGLTGQVIANFFGIDDPNFRGGARTAVGDVNGDGTPDLIVAAGYGGGPRVAIFDGRTVFSGTPQKLVNDFYAFEPALRNGVFVAAGDLDGDGKAEVIAGAGPGGGPRVTAFSGAGLIAGQQTAVANFLLGDVNNRDGIPVATANLDGDGLADLVVGTGEGAGSRVTGYYGKVLATGSTTPTFSFDEQPGFDGGVYVG